MAIINEEETSVKLGVNWRAVQWVLAGVLAAAVFFMLGYWAATSGVKPPLKLTGPPESAKVFDSAYFAQMRAKYAAHLKNEASPEVVAGASASETAVVASRNGAKYYPKDCAAANKIKPENLLIFTSASQAELAGYTRSAQCK